jgi:PII-like signaling protein
MIIDIVKEIKNVDLTIEQVKEDLLKMYSDLTNKFTNKDRIDTIVNILREEAQFDANQLQDGTMTFSEMIMQDGFIGINFDLWLLLVHYKIQSIFISKKVLPETRFNLFEFVCYKDETDNNNFVFIMTPAMYRRLDNKLPHYKVIVDDNENININLDNIKNIKCKNECIEYIQEAINGYYSIETYLDDIFHKDITTNYKFRQPDLREIAVNDRQMITEAIKKQKAVENCVNKIISDKNKKPGIQKNDDKQPRPRKTIPRPKKIVTETDVEPVIKPPRKIIPRPEHLKKKNQTIEEPVEPIVKPPRKTIPRPEHLKKKLTIEEPVEPIVKPPRKTIPRPKNLKKKLTMEDDVEEPVVEPVVKPPRKTIPRPKGLTKKKPKVNPHGKKTRKNISVTEKKPEDTSF